MSARTEFIIIAALMLLGVASCSRDPIEVPGYDSFERKVSGDRIGNGADQWIELKNSAGEWERVGLMFGYQDDLEECAKAIDGLRQVNFAREYRCSAAN